VKGLSLIVRALVFQENVDNTIQRSGNSFTQSVRLIRQDGVHKNIRFMHFIHNHN